MLAPGESLLDFGLWVNHFRWLLFVLEANSLGDNSKIVSFAISTVNVGKNDVCFRSNQRCCHHPERLVSNIIIRHWMQYTSFLIHLVCSHSIS
ncbi:MAG: hypothetical protein DF168_01208 [Candidatus Moanabacter tarae]|uniref:Uncharacterized protein n=1 Tax=Candidatus Moanibacter tarae TaxID=2200854 RepID=A0A2Z4ACW0_9BACT|nr:MAG: hypothetical protein DF168_01208 [Candidatus Moanabacter tarae]